MRVFRRGQEVVAQRCSEVVSRHLHGQALTIAAANRRVDIFKTLLESNLEYNSEELIAALNSVSGWADEEILQLLLKHDAEKVLGIQQYSGGLNHAARNNNSRVVLYWLEKHPEHDNLAVDPATVIDVSANGFLDVLIPLIDHIRRKGSFERTLSQCLPVASKNGHDGVVEYLIGKGADVNTVIDFGEDLFYDSYPIPQDKYGSTRKLSALQAALIGFDRYSDNKAYDDEQTRAAALSQKRTIKLLLKKGADPNEMNGYERYPLEIAAAYCTVEIVQELISSGAGAETVTREHGTALQAAVHREINGLPIIKALLGATSSLPSRDQGKAAALNEALSFFGSWNGNLIESSSVREILNTGPGAVVKFLLANLPDEKAINSGYCLLAQMACMAGDIECIDLLLQRGLDVNFSGYYYGTVLQAASRVGNIKIVECLLKSGAEVNILQGVHGTPLRAAVIQGHEDLVRTLIIHGADVNLRYEEQDQSVLHLALGSKCYEEQDQSVLHLALGSKNNAIFKLLLDAGAEKNIRTNHDQHVLILACKHGDATLVGRLLASGVDVGVSGTKLEHSDHIPYEVATPLHAACANGHFSVVRLLVDHGADIEKTNESSATPLIAAVRANNLPVVRLLLDAGADVNHALDVTALSEAAEKCELEIVEELLSAGAIICDLSTKENALARACRSRHHIVAELLLANLRGNKYEVEICHEALSAAIESDEREMVRLLLEHGLSPSFKMLRCACRVGVQEVVRMLADTGIDVNEDDGEDEPLLHVAACHSKVDIVQFLISRGANTMLRSARYGSPLIAALEGTLAPNLRGFWQPESCLSLAMNLPRATPPPETDEDIIEQLELRSREVLQCEQIVRMLLDEGAEMDTTIRKFGNVLHLASYMGREVIVRQLLERMEDVNIIGGYFESPLIAGLRGKHPTIVDLLLDRGSDVNQFLPEHGSALHYACKHSSKRLIQSLLDHGADINAYDDKHGSILAAAISYTLRSTRFFDEERAIVELLLRHEPKVQIRECNLLAAASRRYNSDGENFMRLLFQHDASIVATEAVIVKIIQNYSVYSDSSNGVLRLVLEHDGGLGTTPAMVEAAGSLRAAYGDCGLSELAKITKMLLENQPLNQATADRLKSLSKQVALELQEQAEKERTRYQAVEEYVCSTPCILPRLSRD